MVLKEFLPKALKLAYREIEVGARTWSWLQRRKGRYKQRVASGRGAVCSIRDLRMYDIYDIYRNPPRGAACALPSPFVVGLTYPCGSGNLFEVVLFPSLRTPPSNHVAHVSSLLFA